MGFEEIDDGEWGLYLGPMKLSRFHEPLRRIEDAQGRLARKRVLSLRLRRDGVAEMA